MGLIRLAQLQILIEHLFKLSSTAVYVFIDFLRFSVINPN